MKKLMMMTSAAIVFAATTATATVFEYTMNDHPNTLFASDGYSYGLRLDGEDKILSFDNGSGTTLTYDDVANIAVIDGVMRESLGNGLFGDYFTIRYEMTDLTNTGYGLFSNFAQTGEGFISSGDYKYELGAKANHTGASFLLTNDCYRMEAWENRADTSCYVGIGWESMTDGPRGNANDYITNLTLVDTNPAPVPLPAGGALLLGALGFLGFRKVKS